MNLTRKIAGIFALATIAQGVAGCRTTDGAASEEKGFSAVAEETNIAVIMNSYGHTPSFQSYFDTDLNNFKSVITDPTGGYRFKTLTSANDDASTMMAQIQEGAAQVSTGGTLLVFITAHGATNGMIESRGSPWADVGYAQILGAIEQARQGRPFRRFVMIISACYSGSWFPTMQSSGGLIKERLAISSVGPNIESNIGEATGAMLATFQQFAKTPNFTMGQFLETAKRGSPNIMYVTTNDALLREPLLTPKGSALAETNTAPTGSPAVDGAGAAAADVVAMTTAGKAGLSLIVYAKTELQAVELYNDADSQWYAVSGVYGAQKGYPTIRWMTVNARWSTVENVKLRVTSVAGSNIVELPLVHK